MSERALVFRPGPVYFLARALFWVFGKLVLWMHTRGHSRIPHDGGVVVAANHFSTLDPPVMGTAMRRPLHFMAKKELFERPFTNWLWRELAAFPVDRERSDMGAIKEALKRIKSGQVVGVFIQGTRNAGDADALHGAAFLAQRAGVPVVPAAIWRRGLRYTVAFGDPITVGGRDREAMAAGTEQVMAAIRGLLPSDRTTDGRVLEAGASDNAGESASNG
jgi:1-acyl-sn-glycerol-3-phosphate acyltransferase